MTTSVNLSLLKLPTELHVRIFSYLRANCLAKLQQTCTLFNVPSLVHLIVTHIGDYVYPPDLSSGFEKQPVGSLICHNESKLLSGKKKTVQNSLDDVSISGLYTFEHLRNMELLVIARVLSSPEPTVGFVVSKSWCKTALKWLEIQQEGNTVRVGKKKGKGSRKSQKLLQNNLNKTVVPCPNVNSDITCCHDQLSAKSRRRLLDRKAWKTLKILFPDSTTLESVSGECVQCRAEAEILRKNEADEKENEKTRRKLPLSDPELRRLYTRSRGVPEHRLRNSISLLGHESTEDSSKLNMDGKPFSLDEDQIDCIEGHRDLAKCTAACPLEPGSYCLLPRSWCHGWRRYMKTGEGASLSSSTRSTCLFAPPDAAGLLCDAHSMALLPPHLESYLYDELPILSESFCYEQKQLLRSSNSGDSRPSGTSRLSNSHAHDTDFVPGQSPAEESVTAIRNAGISESEMSLQVSAMLALQMQNRRVTEHDSLENNLGIHLSPQVPRQRSGSISNSELLDRENHVVVEILTKEELRALERCWPRTTLFAIRFNVSDTGDTTGNGLPISSIQFNTPFCRECDASGRQGSVVIKNRARNWLKKSSEKARAPASLEY